MHILHAYTPFISVKISQFLSHVLKKIYLKFEVNVFYITHRRISYITVVNRHALLLLIDTAH